ncbi:MAG TPA: GtrA family protein [Pilimelia sp.]|nr:GtrA family protein [Pilimelia sp.]
MTSRDRPAATAARPGRAAVRALLNDRRVRYVLAGGVSSACYYGLFAAGWLLPAGRVPYLLVALAANVVTAVLTYPLYRRAVFRRTGPALAGFWRFYATCLWALAFTLAGLPLLVEVAGLPVLPAQALVIVAAPLLNYQIHRFWAFRGE